MPPRQFQIGESRSLAKLAKDKNDLVGLISYGIFKFEQSEWAREAQPSEQEVQRHSETLQETRIQSLRSNAELRLSLYASSLEKNWREQLYEEIRESALADVAKEVDQIVTSRLAGLHQEIKSGLGITRSIVVNVVGWLITLAITGLVLSSYFSPTVKLVATGSN